jgi:hypothetical protein
MTPTTNRNTFLQDETSAGRKSQIRQTTKAPPARRRQNTLDGMGNRPLADERT